MRLGDRVRIPLLDAPGFGTLIEIEDRLFRGGRHRLMTALCDDGRTYSWRPAPVPRVTTAGTSKFG